MCENRRIRDVHVGKGWREGDRNIRKGEKSGSEAWREMAAEGAVLQCSGCFPAGSVASSEQTKHWSQLNITFPSVHKP